MNTATTARQTKTAEPAEHHSKVSSPTRDVTSQPKIPQEAGNLALQSLLKAGQIQAKLEISQPDDPYEKEADQVARSVASGHSQKCYCGGKCSNCQAAAKLRRSQGGGKSKESSVSNRFLSGLGTGRSLNQSDQKYYGSRMGADFSKVRIHSGERARDLNTSINSKAFALGNDLVFKDEKGLHDRELMAHELTHVMQTDRGVDRQIRKCGGGGEAACQFEVTGPYTVGNIQLNGGEFVTKVGGSAPNIRVVLPAPYIHAGEPFDIPVSMLKSSSEESVNIQVRILTDAEFEAMTGLPASALPENQLVSLDAIQQAPAQSFLGPGAAPSMLGMQMPQYPLAMNSTGILWGNGHLSVFSQVNGQMTNVGGFRSSIYTHFMADVFGGRWADSLSTGAKGQFHSDSIFTMMPQGKQTAVYIEVTPLEAAAMGEKIRVEVGAPQNAGTYRYPPPEPGTPLYERLFNRGSNEPIRVCQANNCITQPRALVKAAIGTDPIIIRPDSTSLNIATGEKSPSGVVDIHQQGRGSQMRDYVRADNPAHEQSGVKTQEIPGYTRGGRAGTTFVRGAGGILLIYGVYKSTSRIAEASDTPHLGRVVTQEAGSWVGGLLGSALGAAAVGAVVCSPTGPVTLVCAAGGFAGGLVVGVIGAAGGSYIADVAYDATHDRHGNFNPISSGIEYVVDKGLNSNDPQVRSDARLTGRAFLEGDTNSMISWMYRFSGM